MILGRKVLALAAVLGCAAGCGDGDEAGPKPMPGEPVWNADVRSLRIGTEGGGLTTTPPGSECHANAAEYKLDMASLRLEAVKCAAPTPGEPLRNVTSDRALSTAELDALIPALESLKIVEEMSCGADKPEITLAITTAGGTREYRDSFYSCIDDPRPTVASTALDDVLHRLGDLAAR